MSANKKSSQSEVTPITTAVNTDRRESTAVDYTSAHPSSTTDTQEPATMSQLFEPLDDSIQDSLHAKRLLVPEEKYWKRVSARLLAPSNPIFEYLKRTAVDSDKSNDEIVSEAEDESSTPSEDLLSNLSTFQACTIADLKAIIHDLTRIQFLLNANERERERYATQASSITTQQATIRSETAALRTRLTHAREQLQIRKEYDVLAEKVLWVDGKVGGTKSKTREEISRESEKLAQEIEELEREGEELNGLWRDRRDGLGDVKRETTRLRRIVKGQTGDEDADGRSDATGLEENELRDVGTPMETGTPLPVILEPDADSGAATPVPGEGSPAGSMKRRREQENEFEESDVERAAKKQKPSPRREGSTIRDGTPAKASSDVEMPDDAEKDGK